MGIMERLFPAWTGLRAPLQASGSPTENHGAAGPLAQVLFSGPSPAPTAPVFQLQRPLGTLTVCWSRQGWQVYSKLANWQYLVGPQSSSMMHSCGDGGSGCLSGRGAADHSVLGGQSPTLSQAPQALGAPAGFPDSPPSRALLAPAPQPLAHTVCSPAPHAWASALQDAAQFTQWHLRAAPRHISQAGSTETRGWSPS